MNTAFRRAAIAVTTAAVGAVCWAGAAGTAHADPAVSASVSAPGIQASVGVAVTPGHVQIDGQGHLFTPGEAEYP